ncbi:MAG TPA: large conductance mechanosensitive channel protein MscL [Acholeplasmataceae bacterium]|nr:large conductance mechanosensitive channel protein MscL [Acholeplasmataceae bacterium]
MKKWLEGFKKFINRGNILDLAIGVVIGGAFGKIVNSMVNDIIFPLLAAVLGEAEFTDLSWKIYLRSELDPVSNQMVDIFSTVRYGNTIQLIVEFLIIALVIYTIVIRIIKGEAKRQRELDRQQREAELQKQNEAPVVVEKVTPEDIKLLMEIRDLLKKEA